MTSYPAIETSSQSRFEPETKYFPLVSHAGQTASARPSVTCFVSPVSKLLTKIAGYKGSQAARISDPLRASDLKYGLSGAVRHHPLDRCRRRPGHRRRPAPTRRLVSVKTSFSNWRPGRRVIVRRILQHDLPAAVSGHPRLRCRVDTRPTYR